MEIDTLSDYDTEGEELVVVEEEIGVEGRSASINAHEWALIGDSYPWWNGFLWPPRPIGDQSAPSVMPSSIRAFAIPGVKMNSSIVPSFGPLLNYLGITPECVVSQFEIATLTKHKYKKLIVFGGGNDVLLHGPCRADCYYADNPDDKSVEYCKDEAALPSIDCQGVINTVMDDLQTVIVDRASERGVTDIIYAMYPQLPDWTDGDCYSCNKLCLGWPIDRCLRNNECGDTAAKTTAALNYALNKARRINAGGINFQVVDLTTRFMDSSGKPDKTLFDRCDSFNGIHPSVKGSQRIADALWEAMQNSNDTCNDGVQNGDEEGVDCGGSCKKVCVDPCGNGIRDPGEEGVDCGGPQCPACMPPLEACNGITVGRVRRHVWTSAGTVSAIMARKAPIAVGRNAQHVRRQGRFAMALMMTSMVTWMKTVWDR